MCGFKANFGCLEYLSTGKMTKGTTRSRGLNWRHEETMVLAELKRKAVLDEEDGRLVWERIAQTISSRFPDRIRSTDQCRRRWDTLIKVYNHIEKYCIQTGQDHEQLDEDELTSMKLVTAYRQDWYNVIQQVCGHAQRKRKESPDCELGAANQPKLRKGSTTGSYVVALPVRDAVLDTTLPASSVSSVP